MQEDFVSAKQDIVSFLEAEVASAKKEFSSVNSLVDDSFDRLFSFACRGKMMRGSLVVCFASALGASREDAVRVGAAVELFQSGVLVHDDIMDGDATRRGEPAIHAQLAQVAGSRFGLGGGICLGDVSLFLSFRLLNGVGSPQLVELFSREAVSLGFGQMHDVFLGVSSADPSLDDILSVYRFKTARYTFVLPLLLAAGLAKREDLFSSLESFGEELGVSFQVRDDVLGLFGDSSVTGKPVGADVREDKKTVVRFELLRLLEGANREWASSLFGSEVSSSDLARLQSLARDQGVLSAVELHARSAESRAELVLDDLQVPVAARRVLDWLVGFNRSRVK